MNKLNTVLSYAKPYKKYIILNFITNFIQIFFSLFTFLMIIPFLQILFETTQLVTVKPDFQLSGAGMNAQLNYYMSYLIINYGKEEALLIVSLFVGIMVFFKNVFTYLSKYFLVPIRNGVVRDVRNKIFAKILALPFSYFTEEKKGDIMSRMTNDLKELEWSILTSIELVFKNPVTIFIYVGTLIVMSPGLSLFAFILIPISGAIIGIIGRSLKRSSRRAQEKMGLLLVNIEETLSGLRVIKAFNAEKNINSKFEDINESYTKSMDKLNKKNYLASPISEFLGVGIMLIIMYYGGMLVLKGQNTLSPEEFIGYIVVFSQIINPAKELTTALYNIQRGMASVERINVILSAENNIIETQNPKEINRFDSSIEFKNVSFKYQDIYVLKNINLKIEKGKTIALVGQSGSGKSTLVDLLPRFYDIEEGEIFIDGINIKELKIKSLRNLMGNVNQEPILFNDSVKNNIVFGAENVTDEDISNAARIANAEEFIVEMSEKYETNIGDRGTKLSGGQRQRLSIARAVLKNPPIMILDEATSALDTESEKLVQDALTKLMQNRTSIVIAHRLSTIKHADMICVLHEGTIVESGTHNELIELDGTYKKLYDLQIF
jgi:subfamily B ATP-binding cassette protein MsbA